MFADVYWNLHRDCYSVRDRATGKVVGYSDHVVVRNARFIVQKGGREATVREGCKRVHAWIRGEIVESATMPGMVIAVTYNPYRADHFQERATGKRIDTASVVWCSIVNGKAAVEVVS